MDDKQTKRSERISKYILEYVLPEIAAREQTRDIGLAFLGIGFSCLAQSADDEAMDAGIAAGIEIRKMMDK